MNEDYYDYLDYIEGRCINDSEDGPGEENDDEEHQH